MSKAKTPDSSSSPRKIRPAISPEARDNQLIAAKTKNLDSMQELKALYADALAAMADYQGRRSDSNE